MRKLFLFFLILSMGICFVLLTGCSDAANTKKHSGGGGEGGFDFYGFAILPESPDDMAGVWTVNYQINGAQFTFNADGTFVDRENGGSFPGQWGMQGNDFTLQYYLNSANPESKPIGSAFTGTLSADRNSISGTYVLFNQAEGNWTATRN